DAKDGILSSALAIVRYDEPIDWDGNPVRFVVGIAGKGDDHLGILSGIALAFSDEDTVAKLGAATTSQEFADLIDLDDWGPRRIAALFGAGNIGRGFIGLLLHEAGYEVVFADVNAALIGELAS